MTHSVKFDDDLLNNIDENAKCYRIGWCFRWLKSERDFYVDTCGMRLDKQAQNSISNSMRNGKYAGADEAFPLQVKTIFT